MGHPRFEPWSSVLYLRLDDGYLRLEADGGVLALALAEEITVPPELAEEDDEFAVASLGVLFVFDGRPALLMQVRYWTDDQTDTDRALVRCAEFEVRGGIRLFVDPMWMPGMRFATGGFHDGDEAERAHRRAVCALEEHVLRR
jgi:hypothetical protein